MNEEHINVSEKLEQLDAKVLTLELKLRKTRLLVRMLFFLSLSLFGGMIFPEVMLPWILVLGSLILMVVVAGMIGFLIKKCFPRLAGM